MLQHPAQIHPLVIVAASVAVAVSLIAAPGPLGAVGAALAVAMIAIAASDARAFIIPDALIAIALLLAFASSALTDAGPVWLSLAQAALRGAITALLFYALRAGYRRWRGRHGLGLGDVKLAGVAGVLLGWTTIAIAVETATLAALAWIGFVYFARKQDVHARSRLPFGLFLAPAIWIGWLLDVTLFAPL